MKFQISQNIKHNFHAAVGVFLGVSKTLASTVFITRRTWEAINYEAFIKLNEVTFTFIRICYSLYLHEIAK